MAYVTAFIFYYFVNHIQEEKDRELLSLIALQPLKHIQSGNDIILGYVMGSESYKTEGLSFEEIKEVVRKMDVNKVIDFGSKDAPQDMTIKDSLEMWYAMAHEWINEILGYGLKIDPEILSLLHILRQHTEKDFKYVEGILGTDKNIVNRYRIAEVAYFTNVVLERLKRYPQTYHHRDDEFNQAINRNRGRAIQKLDEFLKKRAQGDIELEQD